MNTIINNINKLCQQNNLSQRQLALRCNIAISTLNDNMNGRSKFSQKTLNKIAQSFNTTIPELRKNIELDNYFSKSVTAPISKLHILENHFLFFADKDDIIPKHLKISHPFLVMSHQHYSASDLILLFNNTNYIIDTYNNNNNFVIVGKVIGHIKQF